MKYTNLLGEEIDTEEVHKKKLKINPMVRAQGKGPEDKRCKHCKYFYRKLYSKTYFKCEWRGDTNGTGKNMKPLFLTLKKQWFEMTRDGGKMEEYREIKGYWASRLLYKIPVPWGGYLSAWSDIAAGDYDFKNWKSAMGGAPVFEKFQHAYLRLGYRSDAPQLLREIKEIVIAEGRPEWGAEPGKKYFVIRYE